MGWVIVTPVEEGDPAEAHSLPAAFAPLPPWTKSEIPTPSTATGPPDLPAPKTNSSPNSVSLKRDRELKGLMRQVDLAPPNDLFGLNRLTEALEEVSNEDVQRQVAAALRDKLVKAGVWKKHRLRFEIEFYLTEDKGK